VHIRCGGDLRRAKLVALRSENRAAAQPGAAAMRNGGDDWLAVDQLPHGLPDRQEEAGSTFTLRISQAVARASNYSNRLLDLKPNPHCLSPYSCRTQSSLPGTLYGSSKIRGRNIPEGKLRRHGLTLGNHGSGLKQAEQTTRRRATSVRGRISLASGADQR
jgi:hypothetical protein